MNSKQELQNYISSLSPEQAERLAQRMELLKMVTNMEEHQAIYSTVFLGKMFFKA